MGDFRLASSSLAIACLLACTSGPSIDLPTADGPDPTVDLVYIGTYDFDEFTDEPTCKDSGLPSTVEIKKIDSDTYSTRLGSVLLELSASGEYPYLLLGSTEHDGDDYSMHVRYVPFSMRYEFSLIHRTSSDVFCSNAWFIKRP